MQRLQVHVLLRTLPNPHGSLCHCSQPCRSSSRTITPNKYGWIGYDVGGYLLNGPVPAPGALWSACVSQSAKTRFHEPVLHNLRLLPERDSPRRSRNSATSSERSRARAVA